VRIPEGWKELDFRNAIGAAYTYWSKHGTIGSPSACAKYYFDEPNRAKHEATLRKAMLTPEFAEVMKHRGIEWADPRGLTTKQHYALMIICQPLTNEPLSRRLKKAGISQTEYNNWMRDPIFSGLVREQTEAIIKGSQHLAHEALIKGLDKGDLNAVKYYNEMTGRYNPAKEQQADIAVVLTQVIEIIQRNVKDPAVLQAIARDMQMLAASNQLSTPVAGTGGVINGDVYNAIGA
jgi:hypothetical protein